MSLATILGAARGPTIAGVQIDVSVRETHRSTAEVSDAAIETGSETSDHRRRRPNEVALEGIVSNRPTNLIDLATLDSAQDRYRELILLHENNDMFELVTGLRVYQNMMFTSFEVTRDQTTGEIVAFAATMKEVLFARSETVQPNVTDAPKAASTTDAGPKATPPAPPAAAAAVESSASKLDGSLGLSDKILGSLGSAP